MQTIIYIIEVALSVIFVFSGMTVFFFRKPLRNRLTWLHHYSEKSILLICLSKILGGLGILLPLYFALPHILIPISATGLALIMVLACAYHIRQHELKDIPATVILFLAAILIILQHLIPSVFNS